ncbi:hypothetical protein C8R44DRAFT_885192 [Mycena epipterygia]|nr:hypothetical protein C8R44DRAFT_885192 [Mycena epipterygia]
MEKNTFQPGLSLHEIIRGPVLGLKSLLLYSSLIHRQYTSKLVNKHVLIISGSSSISYRVAEACLEHDTRVTTSSPNPMRPPTATAKPPAAHLSATYEPSTEATLEASITTPPTPLCLHSTTPSTMPATLLLPDVTVPKITQGGMVCFYALLICACEAAPA